MSKSERPVEYIKKWIVIPLNGKKPIIKNWSQLRKEDMPNMCRQYKEYKNWGVLTGEINGFIVVDIDAKDGGVEYWKELLDLWSIMDDVRSEVENTRTVKTGSEGYHYYYKWEAWMSALKSKSKIDIDGKKIGIDLKTNGGQVVLDGSIHPETGKKYELIVDMEPQVMPGPLKEFLLKHFSDAAKQGKTLAEKMKEAESLNVKVDKRISPEEIDYEDIDLLLSLIPHMADSYDDWIRVGFALHTLPDKKAAFDLWNGFSSKSNKYDESAVNKKWGYLANREGGITLGSLHYWAQEANPGKYREYFGKRREGTFGQKLWAEFRQEYSPANGGIYRYEIDNLLDDLRKCVALVNIGYGTYVTNDEYGVSLLNSGFARTMKETYIKILADPKAEDPESDEEEIEEIPVKERSKDIKCSAINKKNKTVCTRTATYKIGDKYACGHHKNQILNGDSEKRISNSEDVIMNLYDLIKVYHMNKISYKYAVYKIDAQKKDVLNLFRGFPVKKVQYNDEEIKEFKDLLLNIWANEDMNKFKVLVQFFAHTLMNPGKTGMMIILLGTQGIGKTRPIQHFIGYILGRENGYECVNLEQITQRFNTDYANKRLMFINEIDTNKKHDESILKSMITDHWQRIEGKGTNALQLETCMNFIGSTNNFDLSLLNGDRDRRFYIMQTSDKVREWAYYEGLEKSMKKNANAIYSWLCDQYDPKFIWDARKIREWAPSDIMDQLSTNNRDSIDMFLDGIDTYAKSQGKDTIPRGIYVPAKEMHSMYLGWCREHGLNDSYIVAYNRFVKNSKGRVKTNPKNKHETQWMIIQ